MPLFAADPIRQSALADYDTLRRNFENAPSKEHSMGRSVIVTKNGPYMVSGPGVSNLSGRVTFHAPTGARVADEPKELSGKVTLSAWARQPSFNFGDQPPGLFLVGTVVALFSTVFIGATLGSEPSLLSYVGDGGFLAGVTAAIASVLTEKRAARKAQAFCDSIVDPTRERALFTSVTEHDPKPAPRRIAPSSSSSSSFDFPFAMFTG